MLSLAFSLKAQRDPRTEVTAGSPQEIASLAGAIQGWLNSHGDLAATHFTEFGTIHSTSNFFPWHRAHIRELEEAIGTMLPETLPRWRPRAGTGEPSNAMPGPLQLTNGTPQLAGMPNPDPLVPIPSSIVLPGACTGVDNYSNLVQGDYHDLVHSAGGGLFLSQEFSATVLGFWPWHAWVDEFWYNWENVCTAGYTDFPTSGTQIIIDSEITWSGEHFVKGQVIIEDGGRLNIAPGAVIHFRSSDYEAYETRIVVKPGGLLYVNGGTLTGIDYFGTNVGTGGVRYNSGWKGILVEGTGAFAGNHGQVTVINNAVIEHASIGIESTKGGRIVARNSDFLNNRLSIYIHDYIFSSHAQFYIQGCDFDVTLPLRDVTWTPAGGLPPRHFLHNIPQTPERYILLRGVGKVQILGGTFNKTFTDIGVQPTTGIVCNNARLHCSGASFSAAISTGIAVFNTAAGPLGGPNIQDNSFNSGVGVFLNGSDYATITSNVFNNRFWSIWAEASSAYDIADNTFNGAPEYCVISNNSNGFYSSLIERNIFNGSKTHIQFEQGNPDVQFRCNTFNNVVNRSVTLTSGGLPDQGTCSLEPAGNQWDNVGCMGNESQLSRNAAAGTYTYFAHSDRRPTCVSAGIIVIPCSFSHASNPTCEADTPPCDPCPDIPEEHKIATLGAQKQALAASSLPPAEIAAGIWQLTWEQQIVAQRGLVRVIEADSSLTTAIAYLDEVGDVFPFPASDRIGLYLGSGNLSAANSLIAALPASNDKTLFALLSTLYSEGRSFQQITQAEEQTVRVLAEGSDQASAQAKSILYAAFGEDILTEPELLDGERSAPGGPETKLHPRVPALTFLPNPGQDITMARYTLDVVGRHGAFILFDMYGRQIISQQFSADSPTGEIRVDLSALPAGTYIGSTTVDGRRQAVAKLTVVK